MGLEEKKQGAEKTDVSCTFYICPFVIITHHRLLYTLELNLCFHDYIHMSIFARDQILDQENTESA